LIRDGLPKTTRPRDVIIVGAGMAGLTAAYELLRAGHRPLLLEAQAHVGGRVHTVRQPFSDGLHAEAGAMRIPRSHALTMAYIEQFGLRTLPFTMDNPRGFYHLHGRHFRIAEAAADPDALGFTRPASERGRTHSQLWASALQPLMALLEKDP